MRAILRTYLSHWFLNQSDTTNVLVTLVGVVIEGRIFGTVDERHPTVRAQCVRLTSGLVHAVQLTALEVPETSYDCFMFVY